MSASLTYYVLKNELQTPTLFHTRLQRSCNMIHRLIKYGRRDSMCSVSAANFNS